MQTVPAPTYSPWREPRTQPPDPSGRRSWVAFGVIAGILLVAAPALSYAGTKVGYSAVLAGLLIVVLLGLVVRWPIVGFYIIATCAILIESQPLAQPDGTDQLYVFYWPPKFDGLPERPIGFFLLLIMLVLICQRVAFRRRALRGGPLLWPFLGFLACVGMGVLHGLASGGQFKVIVLEIRPFVYLFECYLLSYNVITTKQQVRTLFWILIVGSGIKGLQAVYLVFGPYGGHLSGQNEIMAHEQSFFWVLVILLIILFALHTKERRQLYVALATLPPSIIGLIANNRRADYGVLVIGLGIAWFLIIMVTRGARGKLIIGLLVCCIVVGGYVAVFSHVNGAVGEPARGLINAIHPSATDQRDVLSNQYRQIEDADLKYTERQSRVLGYGFGKPFLQPYALPDISSLDPVYLFIPHDNVLWIWMRLGPIGYFALWYLFGSIVIRGVHVARDLRDRYLQVVAIFAVTAIVMEVLVAYADYQFYFYRNAMFIGLLIGVLFRLRSLDTPAPAALKPARTNDDVLELDGGIQHMPQQIGPYVKTEGRTPGGPTRPLSSLWDSPSRDT